MTPERVTRIEEMFRDCGQELCPIRRHFTGTAAEATKAIQDFLDWYKKVLAERQERGKLHQRLFDLLRHQRGELHTVNLISNDEFAELAKDHPAVDRLESYDAARERIAQLEALLQEKVIENERLSAFFCGDHEACTSGAGDPALDNTTCPVCLAEMVRVHLRMEKDNIIEQLAKSEHAFNVADLRAAVEKLQAELAAAQQVGEEWRRQASQFKGFYEDIADMIRAAIREKIPKQG